MWQILAVLFVLVSLILMVINTFEIRRRIQAEAIVRWLAYRFDELPNGVFSFIMVLAGVGSKRLVRYRWERTAGVSEYIVVIQPQAEPISQSPFQVMDGRKFELCDR
jgi:hypothetical protein